MSTDDAPDPVLVAKVIKEWKAGDLDLGILNYPLDDWWGDCVLPNCECGACGRYWELKQEQDEAYVR